MQMQCPASYSNIKTQVEELDEDRQRLLEEQRINRAKARKLTLQTIRRRKALEEKRREDEEKEQRFREEVLQERKLKQQDATERFQRAHLPPAQRRQNRIGYRKQVTRLEEALKQIQSSPYVLAPPLSAAARPTVNDGTTDSFLNLSAHGEIRNGSRYQKQLSAAKAYAKFMQETSEANLKNSRLRFQQELEETQRLLGEQQLNGLQEFRQEINQLNLAESLTSLDSLETEGQHIVHPESDDSIDLPVQNNNLSNNIMRPHPPVKNLLDSCKNHYYPLKKTHVSAWINDLDSSRTQLSSPGISMTNRTQTSTTKEYLNDKLHASASESIGSEYFNSSSVSSVERHQNIYSSKFYNSSQHKITDSNSHSIENQQTTTDSSEHSLGRPAHSATILCDAWSTPDLIPKETTQLSDVNDRLEPVHQNELESMHPLKLPFTTPVFLTSSQKSQTGSDRTKADSMKDSETIQQMYPMANIGVGNRITVSPFTLNQNTDIPNNSEDSHTSFNKYNFNVKSRHVSEGASQKPAPSQATNSSESDSGNNATKGKENEVLTHSSMSTTKLKTNKMHSHEKSNFKLLKGILKKVSKYENGFSKSRQSTRGVLGIQMASSIRDSVELIKMKELESDKNPAKKKLRWLDEIEQTNQFKKGKGEVVQEQERTVDISAGSTNQALLQSPCFESNGHISNVKSIVNSKKESKWNKLNSAIECSLSGHQQKKTWEGLGVTASVTSETTPVTHGIRPAVSPGYHFTKQAWAAKGTRSIDHKTTAKNAISNPEKPLVRIGHAKVIKRAQSAMVYFRTGGNYRKGTIIRPQSASEVMKSHGKILVPHPPPKPAIDSKQSQRTTGNFKSSWQSHLHPANVIGNCSSTPREIMPEDRHPSSKINAENATVPSFWPQVDFLNNRSVTITTFPSSYLVSPYETVAKATYSVNAAKALPQKDDIYNGTKQDTNYEGNRLCLDCTPTEEEITLLWHGVRSALAQKDSASGDSRNYPSSRNSERKIDLQPHQTNVAQLTIDGSSLLNGVRSVSSVGRLLSAPSGAFVTAARRKHPMDTCSNGTKHRALLEQRRMNIGSTTHKSGQITQNIEISPFPSAFDPAQTINAVPNTEGAVSESTEQFMLAENLVETSAVDNDILTAMEAIKTQRYNFIQNKVQRLGLSALSFEEQKILQSLDRLDQRLQYIQETVQKSTSNGLSQIPSSFIIANGGSGSGSRPEHAFCGTQKHRSLVTDARVQKKY
ncbi:centrosomal protein of 126 kDa isoform X2 [Scyliorhinus canicula]|uniref:centrosomal protein of 126 kDa isoform X2 n=1 Tax=Scyliorhinus canicula TaxID=7830 RepID=UPI0018F2BBD4|nr:centrosomal protein of 126 kDa isoform X2 [Scyliorhinus canicula]